MERPTRGLRGGRILQLCAMLAAAVWCFGWVSRTMRRHYLDQQLAAAIGEGNLTATRLLLTHGANPNSRTRDGLGYRVPVLFVAIRAGNAELTRFLLDRGADPNEHELGGGGEQHFTPAMEAARLGKTELLRLLLDRGARPDSHDDVGLSALMCAAISGNTETVQLLLDRGADPSQRDARGFSPLLMAESRHRDAVLVQLTRVGAVR